MIIAFSGKMGVGKTTAAEYLVDKYNYKRFSFAQPLKETARRLGWNGEKDAKGRRLLQELGLVLRNYDIDYWINCMVIEMQGYPFILNHTIDDVRFKNEAEWVHSQGGIVIRIIRDTGLETEAAKHVSETELDNYDFMFTCVNNSSLEDLYAGIDSIMTIKLPQMLYE